MDIAKDVIFLIAGLVVGAGAMWFALSARIKSAEAGGRAQSAAEAAAMNERLRSAEQAVQQMRADMEAKNGELSSAAQSLRSEAEKRSAAEQLNARIPELQTTLSQKDEAIKEMQEALSGFRAAKSELETRLADERTAAEEKFAILNEAREKLSDAFKALSSEALKSNNQAFLDLAKSTLEKFQETAKGDLEKRQQSIVELVKPVRESLEKFDNRMNDIEKERVGAYESLTTQVKNLMSETGKLVRALHSPSARGRWGEIQLKRVVEMAGMVEYCDFTQQQSVNTDDGRLRPDLIVRLPADKLIVVDAKAPLNSFLEAYETSDEALRDSKITDHARHIRNHINDLNKKTYWDQFPTAPEFVVLFLPGENFFSAALEKDPVLIEYGVDKKVIIATPTTLIALLRAVAYGWQQATLAKNAMEISELGKLLYDRIRVMADHWAKVGRNLDGAVKSYNDAVGSLESRVLVSARKFKELQSIDKELDVVMPVETASRQIQAPDLKSEDSEEQE